MIPTSGCQVPDPVSARSPYPPLAFREDVNNPHRLRVYRSPLPPPGFSPQDTLSDPRLSERAQRSLYSRGSMSAAAPDQTDLQTGTEGSENQVSSRGCLGTVKPSRRRSPACCSWAGCGGRKSPPLRWADVTDASDGDGVLLPHGSQVCTNPSGSWRSCPTPSARARDHVAFPTSGCFFACPAFTARSRASISLSSIWRWSTSSTRSVSNEKCFAAISTHLSRLSMR